MNVSIILVSLFAIFIGYLHMQATSYEDGVVDPISIEKEGGKWMKLRDGRIFEYFESGEKDSQKVVIVIGGYMTTAKGMNKYADIGFKEDGNNKKIRVVCVSIPGHGKSSYHAGRTLKNFAEDVEELVNHLGIKRFAVFGLSFGGPHAKAVAYYLDSRVDNVALLSALCHNHFSLHPLGIKILTLVMDAPFIRDLVRHYVFRPLLSDVKKIEEFMIENLHEEWTEITEEAKQLFFEDALRSGVVGVQGLAEGPALGDGRIPYPFEVRAINNGKRKIYSYGGTQEKLLPFKEELQFCGEELGGLIAGDYGHLEMLQKPKLFTTILQALF